MTDIELQKFIQSQLQKSDAAMTASLEAMKVLIEIASDMQEMTHEMAKALGEDNE